MQINLVPYLAIWCVFALAVVVLLVIRKVVSSKEDDQLHVLHGANPNQANVAHQLDIIDKWGKILTVIALVYGLAIAAYYVFTTFSTRGGM